MSHQERVRSLDHSKENLKILDQLHQQNMEQISQIEKELQEVQDMKQNRKERQENSKLRDRNTERDVGNRTKNLQPLTRSAERNKILEKVYTSGNTNYKGVPRAQSGNRLQNRSNTPERTGAFGRRNNEYPIKNRNPTHDLPPLRNRSNTPEQSNVDRLHNNRPCTPSGNPTPCRPALRNRPNTPQQSNVDRLHNNRPRTPNGNPTPCRPAPRNRPNTPERTGEYCRRNESPIENRNPTHYLPAQRNRSNTPERRSVERNRNDHMRSTAASRMKSVPKKDGSKENRRNRRFDPPRIKRDVRDRAPDAPPVIDVRTLQNGDHHGVGSHTYDLSNNMERVNAPQFNVDQSGTYTVRNNVIYAEISDNDQDPLDHQSPGQLGIRSDREAASSESNSDDTDYNPMHLNDKENIPLHRVSSENNETINERILEEFLSRIDSIPRPLI